MLPYFFLIGFPFFLSALSYKKSKKLFGPKFSLTFFFIALIIMLSLRSVSCGVDLNNYLNKFTNVSFASVSRNGFFDESGFELLMLGSKWFYDSFQFFLFICAVMTIVPIMLLYREETSYTMLPIALFVTLAPFTLFFSGLRQSIAIGIGAICFTFCKKKKFVPFLCFVFLAFWFHRSAVILLLMYPLFHLKKSKNWTVPIVLLLLICLVYNKQIFSFFLGLNSRYESRYSISNTGSYTVLLLLAVLSVFSFLLPRENADEIIGMRRLLVLSLFLQCFVPINSVAMRLNYYYLIFVPILIPKVFNCSVKSFHKYVTLFSDILVCVFIFWFFKEAYTGANLLHVFPYVPFWE